MSNETTIAAPLKVTVLRSVKQKGHKEATEGATETIEVRKFATQPAVVRFGLDAKKCANFNSAGATVGIELPCYVEEIEEGFEEAKKLARERLIAELPGLTKILDQFND